MWAAEMTESTGIKAWITNSQIVHAVAEFDTPTHFERREVVMPVFAHEPTVSRAPTGEWVMYFTTDFGEGKLQYYLSLCFSCSRFLSLPLSLLSLFFSSIFLSRACALLVALLFSTISRASLTPITSTIIVVPGSQCGVPCTCGHNGTSCLQCPNDQQCDPVGGTQSPLATRMSFSNSTEGPWSTPVLVPGAGLSDTNCACASKCFIL